MREFDLLKEVDVLRRANSLNVETMVVRKQSARDIVTSFFQSVLSYSRVEMGYFM